MPERRTVRSYCRTCLAACGVLLEVEDERVLRVMGDPDHPLSRGYTCPKGRAMGALQHHPERLDTPRLAVDRGGSGALRERTGASDGSSRRRRGSQAVAWPRMLEDLTGRIGAIRDRHGPAAFGLYLGTGGGYDSLGLFVARALQGALPIASMYSAMTIDTPCLPLVSSLMSGSMVPNPVLDVEDVHLTLMLGTNPVASHGHTTAWPNPTAMLRRLTGPGRELWVADPRATKTARLATRHLALRPSSDHALLAYLLRELLGPEGGADRAHVAAHTLDVDRLSEAVAPYHLARAAQETGLPEATLRELLAAVRRHGRLAVLTGTGCSMQRNANVVEWLAWSLQIVTNSFERPGGQWFHPGASHRFEAMPDFAEPAFRSTPFAASRPEVPGHVGEAACSTMLDEIEVGNLRALVVLGGDPLTSFPNPDRVAAVLPKLEVLAVADLVSTAMTAIATHVLPCTAPLERHDIPGYMESAQTTVVSQLATPVFEARGDRRPLWWILAKIGEALGTKVLPGGVAADDMEEEALLRALVADGRVDFETIRDTSAVVLAPARRELRGWVEAKLPQGRWRLAPAPVVAQLDAIAEVDASVETLRLVSGRQLRKMNSALCETAAPGERLAEAAIHLSETDAARAGIEDGVSIRVRSPNGLLEGVARVDPQLRTGAVWVPHGWAALPVGRLTSETAEVDPLTGMVVQTGLPLEVEAIGMTTPDARSSNGSS